jgi:very-short-patch-repair endonuclease
MLVIEVDGGQHAASVEKDDARSADLRAAGFRVLRFWDNEVLRDVEAVRSSIWEALHNPPPSQPSP